MKDSYEENKKPSEIFKKCRFCEKLLKTLPKLSCPVCEKSFDDVLIFLEHYEFSHKIVFDFATDEDFKAQSEKSICEIVQKKKTTSNSSKNSEFSVPCLQGLPFLTDTFHFHMAIIDRYRRPNKFKHPISKVLQ